MLPMCPEELHVAAGQGIIVQTILCRQFSKLSSLGLIEVEANDTLAFWREAGDAMVEGRKC